jgi:pimeloyl-ACP methyl ester carboxylesterase
VTHTIHTVVFKHRQKEGDPEPEWIVFANSLLTSLEMWSYIVPHFLDGSSTRKYNLILHDQRGHGRSGLPPSLEEGDDRRQTTIPLLARDVRSLLLSREIRTLIDGSPASEALKPVKAVVGVSQGGAAALALATLQPSEHRKVQSIIACDTSAKTAAGNKGAWAERVRLVYGAEGSSDTIGDVSSSSKGNAYARKVGMGDLADVTVSRWFPTGSPLPPSRRAFIERMVEQTDVEGFVAGAQALGDFDLLPVLYSSLGEHGAERALLLAGSLDGAGKVGAGLQRLKGDWGDKGGVGKVEYREVEGSGHLPMVDRPEVWAESVIAWLETF